jgi:putative hemolysin
MNSALLLEIHKAAWEDRARIADRAQAGLFLSPEARAGSAVSSAPTASAVSRLDVSARLCGPPSIDRGFKTIDFLTVIDLKNILDRVRVRFF